MPSVPTTRDVVPGAHVNIVLKVDQPTGRTVSGVVSQLLTRGNHPRGIKVRLADGRVGRVQSMAGAPAPLSDESTADASNDADVPLAVARGSRRRRGGCRTPRAEPEPPLAATQQVGLDAYIKPARARGRGRAQYAGGHAAEESTASASLEPEESSTCPVCGDFWGDVAALTHHVQTHFDD